MSLRASYTRRIFGGNPPVANGTQSDENYNNQNQLQPELLTANCSRMMRGPRANGHYSAQIIVNAGTSPVGTMTVWYSNLPDPDPTNDAHWVQDAGITGINMATVAGTMINVGNVESAWIRYKVAYTSGTISLVVFARAEGTDL